MQVQPSNDLSLYIRHYLFIDNTAGSDTMRLFSDGSAGIVFCSPGTVFNHHKNAAIAAECLPDTFVYGQISSHNDITCSAGTSLFIVVLQPTALNQLLRLPAVELKDRVISFSDLFGKGAAVLEDKLSDTKASTSKIILIENFFRNFLSGRPAIADPVIDKLLQHISNCKGNVSVGQLSDFAGYQQRQIERKFNDAIGLNPKRFCCIVRTHFFLKQLALSKTSHSLTSIGYEMGYSDQSHLVHEFKKITGCTPSQYSRAANPLAVNFLQLAK